MGDFGNPRRKKRRKGNKEETERTAESSDDDAVAIPSSQTAGKRCHVCGKRFQVKKQKDSSGYLKSNFRPRISSFDQKI